MKNFVNSFHLEIFAEAITYFNYIRTLSFTLKELDQIELDVEPRIGKS